MEYEDALFGGTSTGMSAGLGELRMLANNTHMNGIFLEVGCTPFSLVQLMSVGVWSTLPTAAT
jgi:hypothetical protein